MDWMVYILALAGPSVVVLALACLLERRVGRLEDEQSAWPPKSP